MGLLSPASVTGGGWQPCQLQTAAGAQCRLTATYTTPSVACLGATCLSAAPLPPCCLLCCGNLATIHLALVQSLSQEVRGATHRAALPCCGLRYLQHRGYRWYSGLRRQSAWVQVAKGLPWIYHIHWIL